MLTIIYRRLIICSSINDLDSRKKRPIYHLADLHRRDRHSFATGVHLNRLIIRSIGEVFSIAVGGEFRAWSSCRREIAVDSLVGLAFCKFMVKPSTLI
ncbi:hypothetical protein OPV22_011795 [Ensete ventricosum]|uniref:Uncharacterized protein n=1 Tax=Ensete ventricosum TaxID=4639 RepID=A0AAV8RLK1_ENSVE|nr:hypothetical protein OPV22_011795 [Ensete ventricosum]